MYVTCETGSADFSVEGYVNPSVDLDGTFTLHCADTGETLRVNGWLYSIETSSPPPFVMTKAEELVTIYRGFVDRAAWAGGLGYVKRLADGRIRVVAGDVSVIVAVPGGDDLWRAEAGSFEGCDADLETSIGLALEAAAAR